MESIINLSLRADLVAVLVGHQTVVAVIVIMVGGVVVVIIVVPIHDATACGNHAC